MILRLGVGDLLAMLRGDHHARDTLRAAVAVFDGDLRLSIGPEKINFIGFANLGEALREAVGELDRHGHQFFGFIASETKHQALVASAAGIYTHGNIGRLALDGAHDGAGIRVVAILRAIVANPANGAANEFVIIDVRSGGNFTSDNGHARGDERLASDTPLGVLLHDLIKDSVRNLVGNFVRMALSNGLRRE